MWDVDNQTPFAVERGWVRDRNGAEVWLVAVKCTFDIEADGSMRVSAEQPPVLRTPEYNGDPGTSSIKYEADLILTKRTTDVIAVGHAYAPQGRPVTEMEVGLRVGPLVKKLKVSGDRAWRMAGKASPAAFVKMPLVYERAFGGVDQKSAHPERDWEWRNPVGTGFATTRDNLTGQPVPNVEYPNETMRAWDDRPRPAGFGAISGHWQPRVALAGTYDDRWLKERQPLLPEDFDERFFQCAPEDQQTPAFLRGGEPVVLRGLTPGGDVSCVLPKLFLNFETRFYDRTVEFHKERRLHTVIIEGDYPRVSLVWHSALPCHFKVQKLARTVVTLKTELNPREYVDQPVEAEMV